jgi:hypothetical protein
MKLSTGRMAGVAWEGTGLRLGILLDMSLYLAIVKPAYKVGFNVGLADMLIFYSGLMWARRWFIHIAVRTQEKRC